MKTVVIIVSVLAVSALALNRDSLKRFNDNFKKCAEEMGKPMDPTNIEMLMCLAKKEPDVLNEQGEMKKDVIMMRLEEFLGDKEILQEAKDIYEHCFDEVSQKGLKGPDVTKFIIECAISVIPHFME